MKSFPAIIVLACLSIVGCSNPRLEPQFSTFSDHYFAVANQNGMSLLDAAKWIHSIGINGVDARTNLTDDQMQDILSAGLEPACAILDLSYSRQSPEEMLQLEDKAIDFCKKYGFNKLMYCPVLLEADSSESVKDSLRQSIKRFADKVVNEGISILFEDYDNSLSITYNMEALDKLFSVIPEADYIYDIGNFIFAGEDPIMALNKYREKIVYVHLKDRLAIGDKAFPIIGTGIAPCKEVVNSLLSEGYNGWFSIELYGAKDMKTHLLESVKYLKQ